MSLIAPWISQATTVLPARRAVQSAALVPSFSISSLGCSAVTVAICASVLPARTRTRNAKGLCAQKAFEDELGVQPPLGYFDPLGLSKDGDFSEFYRRREAELKNGRVAMYATIGYIIPEYFRWPGYLSPTEDLTFADVPNGLQALLKVPPEGWLQILAWCGMYEILINEPKHPSEPGNYYKGRLGILPGTQIVDPEKRKRSLNAELANGRLAMIAISWMWIQDGLHGKAWGEWSP
eukprot:Skav229263  [mRNA]  locus=scaffold952:116088:128236:- [translate_table: standard]